MKLILTWSVLITAIRERGLTPPFTVERLSASFEMRASSPQEAIKLTADIDSKTLTWYSQTFRQEVGRCDDANIMAYEVMR